MTVTYWSVVPHLMCSSVVFPFVFSNEIDIRSCGEESVVALHRNAGEVLPLAVLGSPLAGLLVDDEQPLIGVGQRVDGVVPCRNRQRPDLEVCLVTKRSRLDSLRYARPCRKGRASPMILRPRMEGAP